MDRYLPQKFQDIQVGDRVAVIQLTIDNGMRFTPYFREWGTTSKSWRYGTTIEPWTKDTDKRIVEMENDAREKRILSALSNIDWRNVFPETRQLAALTLKNVGIRLPGVKDGDLTWIP